MSVSTLIHYVCDRCGVKLEIPSNVGPTPDRPKGWGRWSYTKPGATVPVNHVDVCPKCIGQVDLLISGTLLHVGHARQSGSGKTWTELGLERQEDPEKWFSVFAFKVDGEWVTTPEGGRARVG